MRVVANRDIPVLARMLYAAQDVSMTEKKRLFLQDRLWNVTQKITGMPGGHGVPKGLDAQFAAIADMEETYRRACDEFLNELKEAERIISGITNRSMRTFVTMKYMMNMGRREIMEKLKLKRWQYAEMCACVERAEDMAHVAWRERWEVSEKG